MLPHYTMKLNKVSLFGRCRSALAVPELMHSTFYNNSKGNIHLKLNKTSNKCIHFTVVQPTSTSLTFKHIIKHSSSIYNKSCNYLRTFLKTSYNNSSLGGIINKRYFHGTNCLVHNETSDVIPQYRLDFAVPIDDEIEDDLELLEDQFGNKLEFEISQFLDNRLIPYEDADSSFSLPCPSCSHSEQSKFSDIFVDKTSGYFVCPGCCCDGPWEDFIELIDSIEDTLTNQQLELFLNSSTPIDNTHIHLLKYSLLKDISFDVLRRFNCHIMKDNSRVLFTIHTSNGAGPIGFHSLSLKHPDIQTVKRFIEGKSTSVCNFDGAKPNSVVVVPSIYELMHLSQHNIAALSLPQKIEASSFGLDGAMEVNLWLEGRTLPQSWLHFFNSKKFVCYFVKNSKPIHEMMVQEIHRVLKDNKLLLTHKIVSFAELKEDVFHRVTHTNEMHGIKWKRYQQLNNLLLGHRSGELTVLTGATGSGKTTFMAEYSLDLCMQGVSTLWGSFEVNKSRLAEIMMTQFHGKSPPRAFSHFNKIAVRLSEHPLYFLAFHGQQTITDVIEAMKEAVLVNGVQHIIIDNLQFMLGLQNSSTELFMEQDRAVCVFRQFATSYNCHVTIIAHPKKVDAGEMLQLNSISGGARISQESDNVLILQTTTSANNSTKKVLQVSKNRYGGTLGVMPLHFDKESCTFSSVFLKRKLHEAKINKHHNKKKKSVDFLQKPL